MICSQRGREAKGHPSGVSHAARWEAGGRNAWWGGLRAVGGASPVASAAANLMSERAEEPGLSPAPHLGLWF